LRHRATRAVRFCVPRPCHRPGGHVLRALRLGACAMCLMLVSTAIALAATSPAPRGVAAAVHTVRRDRQVLRFFAKHQWLLTDPRFSAEAHRQVTTHRHSLRVALRVLTTARHRAALRKRKQLVRRLASAKEETPSQTICRIFGPDCTDAITVARCESRLHTNARNGQYLGLFQMSLLARQLFGHGDSAEEQARAAFRYFVASGRDWSPWSCRPR
jgi:hypothetical protein